MLHDDLLATRPKNEETYSCISNFWYTERDKDFFYYDLFSKVFGNIHINLIFLNKVLCIYLKKMYVVAKDVPGSFEDDDNNKKNRYEISLIVLILLCDMWR